MADTIQEAKRFTTTIAGKEIIVETGKFAEQAGGSITIRVGDTMLFCSTTMSAHAREGMDFFPLSVDYEEKLYAAGRIPGSFMRREGRPSDQAVLISRVIDRTLRPLFPKNMRNDVQVILMSLSHDQQNHVDMLGIIAASTSLMISNIPWNGPVAGVRIGLINDEFVVNPTISEMNTSILDLRVSGTADAINMVECSANEVTEDQMVEALELAQKTIAEICAFIMEIKEAVGKEKSEAIEDNLDEALLDVVRGKIKDEVRDIVVNKVDRSDRGEAMDVIETRLVEEYDAHNEEADEENQIKIRDVKRAIDKVLKEEVRNRIVADGVRPDGRSTAEIRALNAEVDLIPLVHGAGMFHRGQTQVLTIATLGTPRDSQLMDTLTEEENKRYMHHYNFPPYSTGEVRPLRGPKRREIGHGMLAENALIPMLPPEIEFPYTVRLVSEVLSSNGSTSMASVCGSSLALMDAGVPLKRPVAGIAMGLIKEGDEYAVLTDIQGLEDHLGDMDFKVAGTSDGITALQMDIKIAGVPSDVMTRALGQARDARLQILDVMKEAIAEPRADLKEAAPRMVTMKIDVDKIGAVIGPGGKTVRAIQEGTGVKIDIAEDGTVFISGPDGPSVYTAREKINGLVEEPELGQIYTGKISRLEDYGAFVEFLPGQDGLVHISQLADYRIASIHDEFSVGDEIMVMLIDVDNGRSRLSRQAVLEGWSVDEARRRDRQNNSKRSGNRGGGNRGGGNRGGGNRGGGNRGGGNRRD